MKRIVLYDACVLYPQTLRDTLMYLALAGLFRARWTDAIHDEWIENLLEKRTDLTLEKLTRVRHLMNSSVPDALVQGYEEHIEELHLPDLDDRHVLAAAIHSQANLILTWNVKDFPQAALAPHGIEVITPDDFILDLLASQSDNVVPALHRQNLALTVKKLRTYADKL